jgi:hypothetical protein
MATAANSGTQGVSGEGKCRKEHSHVERNKKGDSKGRKKRAQGSRTEGNGSEIKRAGKEGERWVILSEIADT